MGEVLENGQVLQLNPYVKQVEKLSASLGYVIAVCQRVGEQDHSEWKECIEEVSAQVNQEMCCKCENSSWCELIRNNNLKLVIEELYRDIDEYGIEMSIEKKRGISRQCNQFDQLKDMVQKSFWEMKQKYLWKERVAQSKQSSLVVLKTLMRTMEETTKEIDASLLQEEQLERNIEKQLKKIGVRTLKVMIFVSEHGYLEVHISAKVKPGTCVSTQAVSTVLTHVVGRKMVPERKESLVVQGSYVTYVFVERFRYQLLHAIAKVSKEGNEISGDNFLVLDMPGGKKCAILSDGMGSGEAAYQQSKMMLELAEVLLESGMPPAQAMQMMNTILVTDEKEVMFTTLDMCIVDAYKGEVDILKAGAATSFLVAPNKCRSFESESLPMGVVNEWAMNEYQHDIKEDCYIIMVTDGVLEHIAKEEREEFIQRQVRDCPTKNPKGVAEEILNKSLELQGGEAKDDMMVLVLGVWELHF